MSVSDSDDSGSMNSMLHVRASELYPKKELIETLESASIQAPFTPLCGESIEYIARIADGVLALSNYRVYYQKTGKDGKGDFNIPLGLIEGIEIKELFYLYISCKDCRTYRCSFPSNDVCVDWHRKIERSIKPPKNIDELFAFVYYAWACEEGGEEISSYLVGSGETNHVKDNLRFEYERLKFENDSNCWRITNVNSDYKLCPSYPRYLIVPASVSDQTLEIAAKFRSSRRVPAVVWRHKENGMIIARCSQPEVGWLGWRSQEDEDLLKGLTEACFSRNSNSSSSKRHSKGKLLVMDARSYTSAVANRARGGGCECPEYYQTMEILFMNLANIHSIRKSFHSLRSLCASPPDMPNWHSQLENSKWLSHMSLLISSAVRVATALEKDAQPVLVHCSDGWDRTTQIVSLAELLLDPYYRTIEGFQVLCEREWLEFGHKFADRCGIGEDVNEKCPVFVQWLDCVHNILQQYPTAFEFSKRYLIKLAEHTYSNLFGTFFCNTNAERQNLGIAQRTFSVWRYLNCTHFKNYLYNPNHEKVLWPKYNVRDLMVWKDLYTDLAYDNQFPSESSSHLTENGTTNGDPIVNEESKNSSHELENGSLNNLGNNLGSMLESAINCQPEICGSNGIASTGSETISDLDCDGNSCSDYSVSNNHVAEIACNGSDSTKQETITTTVTTLTTENTVTSICKCRNNSNDVDNSNNSDNEVINALNDEFKANLDLKEDRILCNKQNGHSVHVDDDNASNAPAAINGNKDCDNLIEPVDVNDSQDCNRIVDELEVRLNGGDISVETSVETIVDNNYSINSAIDNELKTAINGLKTFDVSTFQTSRPQLTSLLLDPIDGLPLIPDDIQDRMQQISIEHKAQQAALRSELHTTRYALMNKLCHQCIHQNNSTLPEKQIVSDDDKGSVCSTDISWEAVDEKELGQVLWVPDHAANFCQACNTRFWLGRRRHHCRSCGKIFCADCSTNFTILPSEQLYDPVRVCEQCYRMKQLSPVSYSNSPKQTTCKQAAGEESQNSNLVLPPAPSI